MHSCQVSTGTETSAYGISLWSGQAKFFMVLGFSSLLLQRKVDLQQKNDLWLWPKESWQSVK